jgi:Zn-dependent M28 family amino/carboxypeptidase
VLELAGVAPEAGRDYRTFEFSGSGDVTAPLHPVDLRLPPGPGADSSTSGCEPADFAGFPRGVVALLQRGTCPFRAKVDNARRAGAAAAVIFNEGQAGRTEVPAGTLGGPGVAVPVLAASFEIARRLAGSRPAHTVRFAWWGAEELGLLGSRHYLSGLDRAERDRIALYLNLDMVGSPNFRRLVYDGEGEGAPAGSAAIERVLAGYLRGRGPAVGETSLGSGSDHATFAAAATAVGTFAHDTAPVDRGG